MAALLRGNLMGTCHRQIPPRPQTDIVRHGSSHTGHKIRNTLEAGDFHIVTLFLLIFFVNDLSRGVAGQETLNHKL